MLWQMRCRYYHKARLCPGSCPRLAAHPLFVFAIFFFFSKRDRTIAARVESTFGVLLEIYFLIILLPLWAGARVRARLF